MGKTKRFLFVGGQIPRKTRDGLRRNGHRPAQVTLGVVAAFAWLALTCGDYGPSLPAPTQPPTPGAPVATTTTSSGMTQTTATITGTVNPHGASTSYYFEYGTTTSYGNQTSTQNAGSGFSTVNANFNLTNLQPGTLYHYRVVATNSNGSSQGVDRTFTTGAPALTYGVTLAGVNATGDTSGQPANVTGPPISGPDIPVQ